MKYRSIVVLFIASSITTSIQAQSIDGFWGVDKVLVGDRDVTPVAKWFRYQEDHTYTAGNGWTQNDKGTWAYDDAQEEFLPLSKNGPDEFGAFKVQFNNGKMYWEREEEGMKVLVTLSRIEEMPMSPKDSISGGWDLYMVKKGDEDMTKEFDPDDKQNIFIRTSETYRMTKPDGTQAFGYWHMDAHQPEFHLIDFDRKIDIQVFRVSFKEDMVFMVPKDDENMVYIYRRQ